MPEAPDLEVIKEFLNARVSGRTVVGARVLRPTVLRSLLGKLATDVAERTFGPFQRRGKFLLAELSPDRLLAVNPMLSGAFQYCTSDQRVMKKTCLTLGLDDGHDLRYLDGRQMGMVYYVTPSQLCQVPRLHEQGPDVLENVPFEEFTRRLRPFHGEVKGILTRGTFIAGIGNAYADEILFAAGISPFRRRKSLTQEELGRLHQESRQVVEKAVAVLREQMGEDIHIKVRDFLKVHNKGGQPCPRCGGTISQITANQRITSYCRRCQPGMLVRN